MKESDFTLSNDNKALSENPFVRHQDRLVDLIILTRCSLKHTIADLALSLIFPDNQDVDVNQMLHTASDEDLDMAYALMRWKKHHPVDPQNEAVGHELLKAMMQDGPELTSVDALFKHYRSMNIKIGETSKKAVGEVEKILGNGASLRRFPEPGQDHLGIYGHHIIVEGKPYCKRFAVNPNHGNGKLSFGNKF